MFRDPALVPLSHQHQHALALCVRISRAEEAQLAALQQEVARLYRKEISFHFDAEERVLFPVAERFPELRPLVNDLRMEHAGLRSSAKAAIDGRMSSAEIRDFSVHLSAHIRREERELFEGMQKLIAPDELAGLGVALDADFRNSGMPGSSCELRE